jgi:glucose-1-phosphate thymidylyltransferase
MIALLLCAGFAVRMHPLTENFPKLLLPVSSRPVLDYLMDQLAGLPSLTAIHIVTNARFYAHFERWCGGWEKACRSKGVHLAVHNDGAIDNFRRLGGCGDLRFVLERADAADGVLVAAGDNIFRFPLAPIWHRFRQGGHHLVVALPETDPAKLRGTGVLILGGGDQVLALREKPAEPPSRWFCPPLYLLRPSAAERLDRFLIDARCVDAPGYFIDYLCRREPVFAVRLNASRLDIGSLEGYRRADTVLRRQGKVFH